MSHNPQKRAALATIACFASLLLGCSGPADPATTILKEGTFGFALQASLNKVQDVIRQAQAAGNDLLISAGVQAQNAIVGAQCAYEKSLGQTKDALDDSTRKAWTDIDNLVQQLEKKGSQDVKDALTQAQTIVNVLPFANKRPVLSSFGPHFLVPGNDSYVLHLDGNFPFTSDGKTFPTVVVEGNEGKQLQSSTFTTTGIEVTIPLSFVGDAKNDRLVAKNMTIDIPWNNTWGRTGHAVFKLSLALLPLTPGTAVVTHNTKSSHPEQADRRSGVFDFDSHANDIEENRELHLSEEDITAGWRVVPHSGYFIMVEHREGDEGHDWYNKGLQTENDTTVVWRARTEHKAGPFGTGHSGKIKWQIGCKVARTVTTNGTADETVPLQWGMSKILDYPAGSWKAVWKRYDKASPEFNSTNLENALFQISATGDSFTIKTFGL